jgi:hypothetical protein
MSESAREREREREREILFMTKLDRHKQLSLVEPWFSAVPTERTRQA